MARSPFEDDNIRKLVELSEGPAQKLIRQMENDPVTRALRGFENSPAARASAMLSQTDLQRFMTSASEAQRAFDAYTKSTQWAEVSSALARAHSALSKPETAAAIQRLDHNLKSLLRAADNAFVPLAAQIHSFSLAAAQAVQPIQKQFEQIEAWQRSLADRMTTLQKPWAIEDHLGVSVVGFARIARLHDISSGPAPFHPASSEIFAEELGDSVPFDENQTPESHEMARIDAGLNPEVVAFPPDAYPHVLYSAGFELRIESVAPVRSDNGDETGIFDPQYAGLLGLIENHLRTLIETELQKLDGGQWLRRRVHGDTRRRWQERKDKDHAQRGDSYPLLFYADFMDLADIIISNRNWNEAFQPIFNSKPDFQASMQRLAPVRNTIGHNRPLVRADQITLLGEGFRILNALGVKM